MRACPKRLGPELYDRATAPLSLKLRMLNAEEIETLLYGCVTWTLKAERFVKLRAAHLQVLLRVIGFRRRFHADHATLSIAKALKDDGALREHRNDRPWTPALVHRDRGTAKQGAMALAGDVRDDSWRRESETWRDSKVRLGIHEWSKTLVRELRAIDGPT